MRRVKGIRCADGSPAGGTAVAIEVSSNYRRCPCASKRAGKCGVERSVRHASSDLDDSLQRRAIADYQGRALYQQQFLLLIFRKQTADSFARGADGFGNLFVSERQLELRGGFVLRRLRGPGKQYFRELLRGG